jgi:hypothetical protein
LLCPLEGILLAFFLSDFPDEILKALSSPITILRTHSAVLHFLFNNLVKRTSHRILESAHL